MKNQIMLKGLEKNLINMKQEDNILEYSASRKGGGRNLTDHKKGLTLTWNRFDESRGSVNIGSE